MIFDCLQEDLASKSDDVQQNLEEEIISPIFLSINATIKGQNEDGVKIISSTRSSIRVNMEVHSKKGIDFVGGNLDLYIKDGEYHSNDML